MSDSSSENLNSKYAWRELGSKGLPKRPVSERVADFLEIYGLYDETAAREQASRCIQCPNPTCVSGCPLCNPIPQWMLLTAEGRFLEAAAVLGSVTNMADICTRVCPSDRLCEEACILESISEPVSIQAIERFLVDYAFAHGQADTSTPPPNGLKVAVVGSGPGGLACADELARKGYAVTVFDTALVPGGLLVNGLPAFKLDQSIVQRRIDVIKKRGVVFRLGARLWQEITIPSLLKDFDAVFIGIDARKARPLEIPGADLPGVVQAVPFLLQKNTPLALETAPIDVSGRKVVVIGGGDTAMDCLRAAIRYGAQEALCVYRREQADLPCGKQEYANALEEGARFLFQATPMEILRRPEGRVQGVKLLRTEAGLSGPDQRRAFAVQPGTEFVIDADWVILALGFDPVSLPGTADGGPLAANSWGGLAVDENQMTSMPGVFAGGDLVQGPGLIVDTVRDARRAAASMDAWLSARKLAEKS
jgi:glutamate synthase (NADPH) small chain